MPAHELASIPHIVYGAGARNGLPALVGQLVPQGSRLLLVADPGLKANGAAEQIAALLSQAGFPTSLFSDFTGDPSLAQADSAANFARADKSALVLALGGGSAIDLGKAVAAIACAKRPTAAYELCARDFPKTRLPCICIPTTSGTGAETTRTSVLSRADKTKIWLWGEALKPALVVLDPELTVSLPAALTAATGLDALVHAVEAATNRKAHAANNLYAHEAIRLVAKSLERAVFDPRNLEARGDMQRAAALGGIAIDNCGTALAHNIGHALASLKPIHHGRAVGIAMLATLPWNIGQDDGAFAACAAAMGTKPSAAGFVDEFERLVRAVGMDVALGHSFASVTPEQLAYQMEQPENLPMLNANRRASSNRDRLDLARKVLAFA